MRCLINNSKTYGMLIVLVYSCFSCLIYAEEQTFTVDSALEGLSNSKNALDSHDLKIEYITQWRIYNTDGSRKEDSNIFDRVEAV